MRLCSQEAPNDVDDERMRTTYAGLLALAILMTAGCTPSDKDGSSAPTSMPTLPTAAATSPTSTLKLRGVELDTPTGWRVLSAGNPPKLIDVDTDARTTVTGLPIGQDRIISVRPAGQGAIMVSDCPTCGSGTDVYFLGHETTIARRIGKGSAAVASRDDPGIWLKTSRDATHCTLTKVTTGGKVTQASRAFDCHYELRADTSLGLLVSVTSAASGERQNDAVLSPDALRPTMSAERIHAVVGDRMVTSIEGGQAFRIIGAAGKEQARIPRPGAVGEAADDALISPDGRYLAFLFGDPACPGPRQCLDVWLLDLSGNQWLHLPSMPTAAALKVTDIAWAADGRLLILGDFDEVGTRLAAWRPGQQDLQLRSLSLPPGRSPAFVVWRRP
jgi:hypothetical protein